MNFGENIRRKREELCMTQKELADAVGVTSQYITQIERGTKVLNILSHRGYYDTAPI